MTDEQRVALLMQASPRWAKFYIVTQAILTIAMALFLPFIPIGVWLGWWTW